MNEQCIDCGHEFDIHHLTDGLCSMCLIAEEQDDEDFTFSDYEEYLKEQSKL
jgi:predicted amidophosphoribosyltransferase